MLILFYFVVVDVRTLFGCIFVAFPLAFPLPFTLASPWPSPNEY